MLRWTRSIQLNSLGFLFFLVIFNVALGLAGCGNDGSEVGGDPIQRCGDGIQQDSEQCDDGNLLSNDGCSLNCQLEIPEPPASLCGNGVIDGEESCDDGNILSDDGCSSNCELEFSTEPVPPCGDGVVEGTEECDDGADNSDQNKDACRTDCQEAFCGDGVTDTGEACDDANLQTGDGCTPACELEAAIPFCGDGEIEAGEECDNGQNNSDTLPDACRADCQLATCGDRVIDTGEACDDGNTVDGDACDNQCQANPFINGILAVDAGTDNQNPACTVIDVSDYPATCYNPAGEPTEPGIGIQMNTPDANGQFIAKAVSMPSNARFAALYNIRANVGQQFDIVFPQGAPTTCLTKTHILSGSIGLIGSSAIPVGSGGAWGGVGFPRLNPPNGPFVNEQNLAQGNHPCNSFIKFQFVN